MTERCVRRPRGAWSVAVPAAVLLALGLTGCGDDASGSDEPSRPTSSAGEPSGREPSGREPNGEAAGDPCADIDVTALAKILGEELDAPQAYDEGADSADGCSVATPDGGVNIAVDLRTEHGALEQDIDLAKLSGEEKPEKVSVAGQPGLFIAGSAGVVDYTGMVTHVGDRLLLINVQGTGDDQASPGELREVTLATAEMVAPDA